MARSRDDKHFHDLFNYAPISLWEQDFSKLKKRLDALRTDGVDDLGTYLDAHPDEVEACINLIEVLNVNARTLEMFGAPSRDELLDQLDKIFRDDMHPHFRSELLALWDGQTSWSGEGVNYTLAGERLDISLQWRVLPGYEGSLAQVLVSIEDITARKQAERARDLNEARFHALFTHAPISLWEEDYSALKAYFDELRTAGVSDLEAYLAEHPEAAEHCMGLIRVIDVNARTLALFGATSKDELLNHLDRVFRDEMRSHFAAELVDMWNGKLSYEREGINYSLSGELLHVHLDWALMPGHEQDFGWVLVAIQDINARKKAEEYLRYLGTHDVLTGLYNRAYFEEQVRRFSLAADGRVISVVVADLNRLKYVNDTLGHQAGDDLLRRASEVFKAGFRAEDVVARIGGDEFAILLPGADEQDARQVAERIQTLVGLNNKYYRGPELSISAGAASGKTGQPLEKLLRLADDAMYTHKAAYHRRLSDEK